MLLLHKGHLGSSSNEKFFLIHPKQSSASHSQTGVCSGGTSATSFFDCDTCNHSFYVKILVIY